MEALTPSSVLLVLLAAFASPRALLPAQTAAPQEPGAPPAADLEAFGSALEELQAAREIPGMSAALVHRRRVVWSRGFGLADLEAGTFATPRTRYRIASVSKPFAAVLVMQLVEAGRLSLDAPVQGFRIPRWFAPDPARYQEQPTLVRHLLSHTSEGVPGASYAYNGNAFGDLTWVLEQAAGTSYPRLLEERVFAPLGMEDSFPGHTRAGETRLIELTRVYDFDGLVNVPGTLQIIDPDPALPLDGFGPVLVMPAEAVQARRELLGERFTHWNGVTAAAGIVSSVLDLAKFDAALDEGRLISAESRELLFTPTVLADGRASPYGLGWFVEEVDGQRVVWHYGWLPPTVSALYVKLPERELTFLLLANCDRLSADMPWTREGVRASPFARAFLERFAAAGPSGR